MLAHTDSYPAPVHLEQMLYSGGFPTPNDQQLMVQFHRAPWSERLSILGQIDDERLKHFGYRVIFNDSPKTLGTTMHEALKQRLNERLLHKGDVPWVTVNKALAEIQKLRPAAVGRAVHILDEYRNYLEALKAIPVAAE